MSKVIAFVGGGGKTSAIYARAKENAQKGKTTIITTTTHMQYPPQQFQPLCTSLADIDFTDKKRICICGTDCGLQQVSHPDGTTHSVHKIQQPSASVTAQLFSASRIQDLCDEVLVEADGARMLPLKVPACHEPVIPEGTDCIVLSVGLDCLDKPLGTTCFRAELALPLLQKHLNWEACDMARNVTPEAVAVLLWYGYIPKVIQLDVIQRTQIVVLCNKADTQLLKDAGRKCTQVIHKLASRNEFAVSFTGSYITSLQKGESEYVPY